MADIASGETLTLNNALDLGGNTLTKSGAGELSIRNDFITGGGTINLVQGILSGNGTVTGDVDNNGGTISPGNNPAAANGEAVPEPSTLALLVLGLGIWSIQLARCVRTVSG